MSYNQIGTPSGGWPHQEDNTNTATPNQTFAGTQSSSDWHPSQSGSVQSGQYADPYQQSQGGYMPQGGYGGSAHPGYNPGGTHAYQQQGAPYQQAPGTYPNQIQQTQGPPTYYGSPPAQTCHQNSVNPGGATGSYAHTEPNSYGYSTQHNGYNHTSPTADPTTSVPNQYGSQAGQTYAPGLCSAPSESRLPWAECILRYGYVDGSLFYTQQEREEYKRLKSQSSAASNNGPLNSTPYDPNFGRKVRNSEGQPSAQ